VEKATQLSAHTHMKFAFLPCCLPAVLLQLVLVWAAPNASHPSVAEAKQLAAALWSQAGPKQQQQQQQQRGTPVAAQQQANQLAQLRARAEAAAAARKGTGTATAAAAAKAARSGAKTRTAAAAAAGDAAVPLLHSVWLNFQHEDGSNRILGSSWLLLHGQQWGWQDFGGVPVAVAPGSFIQVRVETCNILQQTAGCESTTGGLRVPRCLQVSPFATKTCI
jgi:hypothetical protein